MSEEDPREPLDPEASADEDSDEAAILARRRAFVVGTLATVLLASDGCKNPFVNEPPPPDAALRPWLYPSVCLSVPAPVAPDVVVPVPPCLSPLVTTTPYPCLSPPPPPRVVPRPCLSRRPTPYACLSADPLKPGDDEER